MAEKKVRKLLADAGVDEATIAASLKLDAIMQLWRRRITKRELGRTAIAELNLPIEMAQLDILFAIQGPVDEFGLACDAEVMVSTVAERLAIDPSRASRLVSDMVGSGYVRRAASQTDARRSVLELTEKGETITSATRAYKFLLLGTYLKSWEPEEVEAITKLMHRLGEWADRTAADRGSEFERQVEAISRQVSEVMEPQSI